jgi:uncharacterized NAD(P)/FAD-binding protein YdhS
MEVIRKMVNDLEQERIDRAKHLDSLGGNRHARREYEATERKRRKRRVRSREKVS